MATDQKTPPVSGSATGAYSAIENEIPTYRAISKLATFSLLCGVLAVSAFAHMYLLAFAVLAVVLGILANVSIRRHADMLTGGGLANAGIALGLIFGLIVTTSTLVHTFIITRDATQFGRQYAEVLQKGTMGDLIWYGLVPQNRKEKTPEQALHEFESAKPKERMMIDQKLGPLQGLKKYLSGTNGGHIHFVDIERHGTEESGGQIAYYALALFEVEGPPAKGSTGGTQYALAIFKGLPKDRGKGYDWWVDDLKYPYQKQSFSMPDKPVDDGHGHGGAGH